VVVFYRLNSLSQCHFITWRRYVHSMVWEWLYDCFICCNRSTDQSILVEGKIKLRFGLNHDFSVLAIRSDNLVIRFWSALISDSKFCNSFCRIWRKMVTSQAHQFNLCTVVLLLSGASSWQYWENLLHDILFLGGHVCPFFFITR